MEQLEKGIGGFVRPKNKFESQEESIQDCCKASNDVQCRYTGIVRKVQDKKLAVVEMNMFRWMSESPI